MKLKASFIKNIEATYGQQGRDWLDNLSVHLKKLSEQWSFQNIIPVEDLSYNFVAVVQLESKLAILKTAPPAARLMAEVEWLKTHKKRVPMLFKIDSESNAFLMEKLEPGNTLKALVNGGDDIKATRIISQIILDLQSADTVHLDNYPHISEHISTFSFLRGYVDKPILMQGEILFRGLSSDRSKDIILHGDLHHDNILQCQDTWKVIDPHGYVGDPCAEVGPMIFNPLDSFPNYLSMEEIIKTRLKILAEMLPFDLERITSWAFCLALRSAAWDIEGFGSVNKHTIKVAKILYNYL